MLPKFTSLKSRAIAGFSVLAIAGATLVPLPASAATKAAAITNTQANQMSAVVNKTGNGPVTVVQVGINVAANTIVQLGRRGDKAAAIDNTQINQMAADVTHRGRGPVNVVQVAKNAAHN